MCRLRNIFVQIFSSLSNIELVLDSDIWHSSLARTQTRFQLDGVLIFRFKIRHALIGRTSDRAGGEVGRNANTTIYPSNMARGDDGSDWSGVSGI